MAPILQSSMLPYRLLVAYAAFFVFSPAYSQNSGAADSQQPSIVFSPLLPVPEDSQLSSLLALPSPSALAEQSQNGSPAKVNSTEVQVVEQDDHDKINRDLAEDEERVLAGGEVKIRKKRFFCKSCFPTQRYGYGGGGGCCGACGQCGGGGYGGGYIQPVRIKIKVRPVYGYGGGGGCCRQQCGVCGRK